MGEMRHSKSICRTDLLFILLCSVVLFSQRVCGANHCGPGLRPPGSAAGALALRVAARHSGAGYGGHAAADVVCKRSVLGSTV